MSVAKVLSGIELSNQLTREIIIKATALKDVGHVIPHLAVIRTGSDLATSKYINLKRQAAMRLGMRFSEYQYDDHSKTEELLTKIHELNSDRSVQGIIVQLPLPNHINESLLLSSIHPIKDVDGLNPVNIGRLATMGEDLDIEMKHRNRYSLYDQLVNVPCAAISALYMMDISFI
ncbi:hypothetical protein WA158_001524 [Blastocystis sp. Blastoise]